MSGVFAGMGKFFDELKRRNVVRVGLAYVVVGWLALQVAEVLLPAFGSPDWVFKTLIFFVALGLPFALLFAWAFELTSDGIKKTRDVNLAASITASTGRRLDFVIIAALVAALAYFIWERQLPDASTAGVEATAADTASEPVKDVESATDPVRSIAVLPFDDLSQQGDQEWFADGLAEEILNSLARMPDLLVAARTSSFTYKKSDKAIPQIATELGVEHVLEGSVRRSAERLRVTAQLIRASDGFHLWSETFDRDVDDMIEIQENVAIEIARALETAMDPEALASMVQAGTRSIPAYEAYLRGLAYGVNTVTTGDTFEYIGAREAFERAIELDPEFSSAYWRLAAFFHETSNTSNINAGVLDADYDELRMLRDRAIQNAIKHERNPTSRLKYEAIEAFGARRWGRAYRKNSEFLKNLPNDVDAQANQLEILTHLGRRDEIRSFIAMLFNHEAPAEDAVANALQFLYYIDDTEFIRQYVRRGLDLRPDSLFVKYQAHRALLWTGAIDEASRLLPSILDSDFQGSVRILSEIRQVCAENRSNDANALFERLDSTYGDDRWTRWWGLKMRGRDVDATALLLELDAAGDLASLDDYAGYAYFDARPLENYARHRLANGGVILDPIEIPYQCKF